MVKNYGNILQKAGADVRILSAYAEWDSNCKRGKKVWIAKNLNQTK